jgi:hypothetical protein
MPKRRGRKVLRAVKQGQPPETVVAANRFNVTGPDGKRRISLFVEEGNAMLALYDGRDTPRFLIAVTPDGGAVMSALEADVEKDIYEDSFRLVVSSGEPEVVLRDAIFKNVCVISPKGVFVSEDSD